MPDKDICLYLVRHANTRDDNSDSKIDVITGWGDAPITSDGKKEAKRLGTRLEKEGVDRIVHSDLKRAEQTAEIVAKECDTDDCTPDKRLRPWNLGKYQGKPVKEFLDDLDTYWDDQNKKVPGGESLATFRKRLHRGLSDIVSDAEDGACVAAFMHSWGLKAIAAWVANGAPDDFELDEKVFRNDPVPPATYAKLERTDGKWKVTESEKAKKSMAYHPFIGAHVKTVDAAVQERLDSLKTKWTAERRANLPASQFAGPDRSYPIADQSDVQDVWDLRGHADDPDKIGAAVERIAAHLGLKPPDKGDDDKDTGKSVGLISFGTAVKADPKDPYKLERSYLVLFSGKNDPDLSGEFFTGKTDFGFHTVAPIYYDHGMDETIKRQEIGRSTFGMDAKGVWIEGQLDRANRYAKDIANLVANDKLGWSSGTAPHVVERKDALNDHGVKVAVEITKWPLGIDNSLTPTPCEPRTRPDIMPVNSYVPAQSFKSLTESMRTEADSSAPQTDPGLGNYAYAVRPQIAPVMASRMATEHSDLANRMFRNRTIDTAEYKHLTSGFGDMLYNFHTGLNQDVAGREMNDWDHADMHYKATRTDENVRLETVCDAIHGCVTRCYNAGADHLLTHGYIDKGEHEEMGSHFKAQRDRFLEGLDDGMKNRKLKENGSGYLPMKILLLGSGRDLRLAEEVEELLAGSETVKGMADALLTRLKGLSEARKSAGRDLGPVSVGYIVETADGLEVTAKAMRSLSPETHARRTDEEVASAKVLLARLAIAG